MRNKKFYSVALAVLLMGTALRAQAPDRTVDWKVSAKNCGDGLYELLFTGEIGDGWHIYDLTNEYSATSFEYYFVVGYELEGEPYELLESHDDGEGNLVFEDKAVFGQKIRLDGAGADISGCVTWSACRDGMCTAPQDWEFEVTAGKPEKAAKAKDKGDGQSDSYVKGTSMVGTSDDKSGEPLLALILEAILWGFAMLLTPCVFPMVPMTISFFMKGSSSPAAGRFKAFMYGLFIVLLYTVPICVIICLTLIIGGGSVTADIFNWLATHWIPNLLFFVIFMVFAASFFGAFEITMPSSIVNKADANSDRKGLGGIFFMALTLVLVSFSCTGPIVGTVLIKSTQGEFWAPMVTMLAFSVAFALPFTVLALFPSLLKKLKSGSWLGSVKVVLGFIEVALGLKFLSIPDQTYHWHLLDREVYLAIWIVVFTLLGLYLLGKIKFKNDDPEQKPLGVFRLLLVIVDFSFVVYLIPGMWGAPLKALSGYLPPLETQDFVITGGSSAAPATISYEPTSTNSPDLTLPHGLKGYSNLDEGLAAAREVGKPVFVDISGHGCTNCREMEARVWSDPEVLSLLANEFVIVTLYTDDKTKLPEEEWVTDENGKVYKDLGRANSYLVRSRFGVNAQPNYTILDHDGSQLVPIRGYNLDIPAYADYLRSGLEAFKK